MKVAEALARADPDRQDHGSADDGDPEASLLWFGACFGSGYATSCFLRNLTAPRFAGSVRLY
jgi:hypothetical protein